MRFQRVLLLNPPYPGARVKRVFCAGLGYIAETLEAAGLEYDVFDMSAGLTVCQLAERIRSFKPDVIGLSMMTYRYQATYRLMAEVKKDFPDLPVAAGGPHVSLFREQVLRDCPAIDYGIVSEGEDPFLELCRGNELETLRGLLYRRGDEIIYSGDRPFCEDLDSRPFPKYRKFDLEKVFNKSVNALPVVSSRGCPFDCIYCPVKFAIGKKFRMRSPQSIVAELEYWYARGYRRFSFADDNFTLVKERVVQLCAELQKKQWPDLLLSCDNGLRADRVDRELLALMRQSGFYRLAFGVEAGNDKVLQILHKQEDIATIRARIKDACELGYEVDLFFLVGSPGETWKDLQDSFRLALEYPINAAYFYNIIPFPKTELFEWIQRHGTFLKPSEEYLNDYPILDVDPVFETTELPRRMRRKALIKAFAITRMTVRRSWQRRLVRYGWLGKAVAFIYTTRFVQDVVLRQGLLRRMVYALSNRLFR